MGHLAWDCSCLGLPAHDARLCNNCYKPDQVYLLMFNRVVHRSGLLPCSTRSRCTKSRDSLHINYGGANEIIKNNFGNIKYEGDIDGGGSASRNFISTNWGFSSTGDFMDDDSHDGDKYIESNSSVLSMNHSVLYMTTRKALISLTYFGFCLKNGDYNVCLHFAEIEFTDEEAYSKLGRHIFNIYIQLTCQLEGSYKAKCCLLVGCYGINLVELMDEWESNTNRRICWGSAGRYWVAGQLQERGSGLPLEIFFREGDAFPLEKGLQRSFWRRAFVWFF
ncbi:hypothetical protein VitviT2T_005034 [Vitis vinifera]|uniref:Malectin domain-containing protein n=1 Tax=Vitis vinifera TaxID=29760 RepID=A0ABY9BRC2_VITVI|nr:hypothetical protein VitviT2T_005034 [Vitis vinifera]